VGSSEAETHHSKENPHNALAKKINWGQSKINSNLNRPVGGSRMVLASVGWVNLRSLRQGLIGWVKLSRPHSSKRKPTHLQIIKAVVSNHC